MALGARSQRAHQRLTSARPLGGATAIARPPRLLPVRGLQRLRASVWPPLCRSCSRQNLPLAQPRRHPASLPQQAPLQPPRPWTPLRRTTVVSSSASRPGHGHGKPRWRSDREESSVLACTTPEETAGWFAQDQRPGRLTQAIKRLNGLRKGGGACHQMSHSAFAQNAAVRQLLAGYATMWRDMTSGDLASCTSVLLNLELLEERLLLQVLERLTPVVAQMPARELVNLMYNVAKGWQNQQGEQQQQQRHLDQQRKAFFAAASRQVEQLAAAGKLIGQDISNAVYACALVGHSDEEMCRSLAQAAPTTKDFNAQNLSNMWWALAKLVEQRKLPIAIVDRRLCSWWAAAIKSRIKDFKAQNLSNSLWAWAKLVEAGLPIGWVDRELCRSFAAAIKSSIKDFNAQHLSNTLWAWAKLMKAKLPVQLDVQMCRSLAQQAIAKRDSFSPQALSNLLWAWATLARGGHGLPGAQDELVEELFASLTEVAMRRMP
jgi:hypothetical protein